MFQYTNIFAYIFRITFNISAYELYEISFSSKVVKVNTITRLQKFRAENIWVSDKNSVTFGRFALTSR